MDGTSDPGVGERLDRLAAEATAGLTVADPRRTGERPGRAQPRRALLVAAAAVVAGLVGSAVAVVVAGGDGDTDRHRVEATDDDPAPVEPVEPGPAERVEPGPVAPLETNLELLAAFRRPRTAADAVPDWFVDELADHEPAPDLSASRAGASLDGRTVYAIPSIDGQWVCVRLIPDAEEPDWVAGGGCTSPASVVTQGSTVAELTGPGGTMVHGLVADRVVGVEVGGERAQLEDGMFVAEGSLTSSIELVWEPQRAALVGACDALAPLVRLMDRVNPVDEATVDALTAAARATDDPAFHDLADALAEPGRDGLDLDEIRASAGEITATGRAAVATCERATVPGWVVVYQPPAGPPGPPAPTVDLDGYGQRQDLAPTGATSESINGPGLGPVTRSAVGDTGVVAFTWDRTNPNLQACLLVRLDGGSSGSCQAGDLGGAFLSIDPTDRSDLQVQARANDLRASFATAEVDGRTWVQRAAGPYFLFVLPPGEARITLHDADGSVVE